MPIIDYDTGTWADPWVQELPPLGKMLFNYLWTNDHINLACLYSISIRTISNETGLTSKQVTEILAFLYPKVRYDPQKNIMWVVNFVKRQFMRTGRTSPHIIAGIRKGLMGLPEGHPFVGDFLEKYKILKIDYPYPIDTLSIPGEYPANTHKDKDRDRDRVKEEEKKEGGVGEEKKEEGKGNNVHPKDFASLYNDLCPNLSKSTKLSTKREDQIRNRLKDYPDIEWWKEVFRKANLVYIPPNDRYPNGWRPDLEFLVSNDDNPLKVYEGKYDPKGKGHKQYGAESLLKKVLQEEADEKARQEGIHSGDGEERRSGGRIPIGSKN